MPRIELDRVTRTYSPHTIAVSELSLEVNENERFVIVGPSGAGKTTVLRLIAGLERPNAGDVRIDGMSVNHLPPRKREVAMVTRDQALYPDWTVGQLLAGQSDRTLARGQRSNGRRAQCEFDTACDALGISGLKDRRCDLLSSGERQRVALARVILSGRSICLFDEPLASLDAPMRRDLRSWLRERHAANGGTWLQVTHDALEAMSLADRVGVMRSGRLVQVATPAELYRRPVDRYVAEATTSHRIAWVQGTAISELNTVAIESNGLRISSAHSQDCQSFAAWVGRLRQKEVLLGLRPEAVRVKPFDNQAEQGPDGDRDDSGNDQAGFRGVVVGVENDGVSGFALVELEKPFRGIPSGGADSAVSGVAGMAPLRVTGIVDAFFSASTVRVQFDLSKALWFDPITEQNLMLED